MFVVGIVQENTNSSVDVMRVEKAPAETYADIGGLDEQIIEIKVPPISAIPKNRSRSNFLWPIPSSTTKSAWSPRKAWFSTASRVLERRFWRKRWRTRRLRRFCGLWGASWCRNTLVKVRLGEGIEGRTEVGARYLPNGARYGAVDRVYRWNRLDRNEAIRCGLVGSTRSAANDAGAAESAGWIRWSRRCEGDHGDESDRNAGSGAVATWANRPKD